MTTSIYVHNGWFNQEATDASIDMVSSHQPDLPEDEIGRPFGLSYTVFNWVDSPEEAELEVVPDVLATCVNNNLMDFLRERYDVVEKADKKLVFRAYCDEFIDRQRACRKLWESHLTREGFYNHFREHLKS